jgi:hypothetical protein
MSGDERTRTADPLLAKQVLYRLSYVPASTEFGTDDVSLAGAHQLSGHSRRNYPGVRQR